VATRWIAEEPVTFVHPGGRRVLGRIAIAEPHSVNTEEASCEIALDGLERTHPIHGASTLQALMLAIRFLGMRLYDFTLKGGRVLHPDEDADVRLDGYFGALLCAAKVPDTSDES
jgi:hypothetical protein